MIDLDALTNETRFPRARLCGRVVAVRPITAAMAHRVAVVTHKDQSGAETLAVMLDLVRQSVPSLTAEEMDTLSVEQLSAIIQLARGAVEEVEATLRDAASAAEGNA